MADVTRKLASIVALDVAGYSARTEADEAKTTAEVAELRATIAIIAKAHNGRVFNTAGDGFMLEFASSLAAVEAAFELAEKCEPKVRVGVHLGDVVVQPNGDLLGHGVNVAARLMAQAPPGSALVSAPVRQSIRGPVAERLQSLGAFRLDKMAETIEAFALAGPHAMALAQPNAAEPVLAVLPFDNLSDDKELQFFSDGVSEEILQVLARGSGLRVIGRTSAFQFRGARKGEAARLLRATHILDGAVRKAGSRLRVSAQLTEAAGGAALWTERYDHELADVFAMQDDVAAKVAASLRAVLKAAPRDRQIDPRAYELYLKAFQERSTVTDDGYRRAEALLDEVVARAPDFADGWALLGTMRTMLLPLDRDGLGSPQHNAALAATQRALALDPNCAIGYWNLSNLRPAFAEYAEKIDLARRGRDLAPSDPLPAANLAGALVSVGRCKDALALSLKALALDPMNPLNGSGVARSLENVGRVQEAHDHLDEVFKVQPPSLWTASAKFMLLFNAARHAEAAAYLDASILSGSDQFSQVFRFLLALPSLPREQCVAFFQSLLEPAQGRPLALMDCATAARFGCADLAFERLFGALDAGRPIIGWASSDLHLTRSATLAFVFGLSDAQAFRADKRFARFCARVGLVDYWRASGHWPDCAEQVPYDFRAECEKAAQEGAKTTGA
jgi:adenylate cyclase